MTDAPVRSADESLAETMKELVASMARALVDSPDSVEVKAIVQPDNCVLILRVASGDLGKVIGKQGRTARSIRTILGAASMKAKHRFALDIPQDTEPTL